MGAFSTGSITAIIGGSIRVMIDTAGMFITPERARRIRFSEPTFRVRPALLVRKGNPFELHSYEQALRKPGIRLAAISGSVEEHLLLRMGFEQNRLITLPDARSGHAVIESGRVDGFALSSPSLRWMMMQKRKHRAEIAVPFDQPSSVLTGRLGYGAFVFRKKDNTLQSAWNDVQKSFIGSSEHLRLLRSFGFTEGELPGAITTAEVLSP